MAFRLLVVLLALTIALFMQTGLCPKCVFFDCDGGHRSTPQPIEQKSCCSKKTAVNISLEEEDSPLSNCEKCGEKCKGSCYETESEMILPVKTVDLDSNIQNQQFVSLVLLAEESILSATPDAELSELHTLLPPPDTVRVLGNTELLL